MSVEERLAELGITLPAVPKPIANYVPFVRTGGLVFLSGQGPIGPDGTLMTGKVGAEVDTAEAARHARLTGLGLLAAMREAAGGFDKLTRVVKLLGMVNAVPDYDDHPTVLNGCSAPSMLSGNPTTRTSGRQSCSKPVIGVQCIV